MSHSYSIGIQKQFSLLMLIRLTILCTQHSKTTMQLLQTCYNSVVHAYGLNAHSGKIVDIM